MSNDLNHLVDKGMVWCYLRIPSVNELLDNYRYYRVKLQVDLIGACQRRQKLVKWTGGRPWVGYMAISLWTEDSADQSNCGFVGTRIEWFSVGCWP